MKSIFDQITGSSAEQQNIVTQTNENTKTILNDNEPNTPNSHRTEKQIRETTQELLRYGLLEESQKPNLYRIAIINLAAINQALEPMDFFAQVDEIRGLVFLEVKKSNDNTTLDEWSHPLVRKQRLTLEQSLLIAILRQYFIAYEQEAGTGESQALVAIDELIPQLQIYLGDTGSEAKERNRANQLLDQLKGHGLVSAPDKHSRVIIRPMIAHLANPENLEALLEHLQKIADENIQEKNN